MLINGMTGVGKFKHIRLKHVSSTEMTGGIAIHICCVGEKAVKEGLQDVQISLAMLRAALPKETLIKKQLKASTICFPFWVKVLSHDQISSNTIFETFLRDRFSTAFLSDK